MFPLSFEQAVALVEKALNTPDNLSGEEAMNLQGAVWMLAEEYLRVRDRIAPA